MAKLVQFYMHQQMKRQEAKDYANSIRSKGYEVRISCGNLYGGELEDCDIIHAPDFPGIEYQYQQRGKPNLQGVLDISKLPKIDFLCKFEHASRVAILCPGGSLFQTWRGRDNYDATIGINGAVEQLMSQVDYWLAYDGFRRYSQTELRDQQPRICFVTNASQKETAWGPYTTFDAAGVTRRAKSILCALSFAVDVLGASVVDIYGDDKIPGYNSDKIGGENRSAGRFRKELKEQEDYCAQVAKLKVKVNRILPEQRETQGTNIEQVFNGKVICKELHKIQCQTAEEFIELAQSQAGREKLLGIKGISQNRLGRYIERAHRVVKDANAK